MCRSEVTGLMLVYASTGDWVAIYRDGRLLDQGHSFQEDRLLTMLGIEHEAQYDVDPEPTGWKFPPTYAELEAALATEHPDQPGRRCAAALGRESIGDGPWQSVECLLPRDHEGPHADWTAWLGVVDPDFTEPGKSRTS